jgi:ABC-type nitrate/sulfonate/bicarbonate transport system substrate-binding protein
MRFTRYADAGRLECGSSGAGAGAKHARVADRRDSERFFRAALLRARHGLFCKAGLTIVALANIYSAGGLIGVKRSSPIATAQDLNGKTVAVGALNNVTHLGARAWVDANGGDSTSVHWLEIQISAMAAAVLSGRIDAAVMDQGVYPTLGKPGDPIRVIGHAYDAVAHTFAVGGWFASADWAKQHPLEAHKFAAAMADAATWAKTHHRESAAILAKYLKESADDINANARYAYGTAATYRRNTA